MTGWRWGERLRVAMGRGGMPWRVVPHLTIAALGSSPGDVMWDGEALHIETDAEEWHVWHELCHLLVVRHRRPEWAALKNYGNELKDEADCFETAEHEGEACYLTTYMLDRMGEPWLDLYRMLGDVCDYRAELDEARAKHTAAAEPYAAEVARLIAL